MDRPVRKDIRLDNYDYSRNGAYFVTICTHNKMCFFWADNDKYKPLIGNTNTAPTISRIMNQFKGIVSRQSVFSVWQRSFYDRILRNEREYRGAWQYIENNPANWENDELFIKE